MLVLIEGNIGASKSTVCEGLSGIRFPEPIIDFLPKFYDDPKRWAFSMQIAILTERYKQWKLAQATVLNSPSVDCLLDRSLYFDHVFAEIAAESGFMNELEFKAYCDLHSVMQEQIYFPDLCLWLRCTPETCLERIKSRGRGCESGVTLDYLKQLEQGYNGAMQTMSKKCPVVEIDAEQTPDAVLRDCKTAIESRRGSLEESWPRWKGGL